MKLKELVKQLLKDETVMPDNGVLHGENLANAMEGILKCEEFEYITELNQITSPLVKDATGKVESCPTFKLEEGMEFYGRGVLYSISLTPEMYDPADIYKPVKDGAAITPALYDPVDFKPHKQIVLTFNPEQLKDEHHLGDDKTKQGLRELLDKVLDAPQEYQVKGTRGVLIRGVFERVATESGIRDADLEFPLDDDPNVTGHMAFYFERTENANGEIDMGMKSKIIPPELKEKYQEWFKGKTVQSISGEDIDNFLKENQ